MKERFHLNAKRLSAVLMIVIISFLMVNRAFFIHIHVQPDGSVHSHAHPFSKSSSNSKGSTHQHTSLEFFLLDQLDVMAFMAFALILLKANTRPWTICRREKDRLLPELVPISPGRAPPACM